MVLDKLIKLQKNSYSPYSNFKVAAILIDADGNEWKGVNVESASYSPTNCAERSAIFSAISNGRKSKEFKEIHIIGGDPKKIAAPCGVCRQVLAEHMATNAKIYQHSVNGDLRVNTVEDLLPFGFSEEDLT